MRAPRFWQQKNLASMLLAPFSLVYGLGAWLDRTFTRPQAASLPVISIGNVTAGGTGKTPTTIALVALLRELGHTPHTLTRGYRGEALTAYRASETDGWRKVGDETLLLAATAPTWVGQDRFASAQAAAKSDATVLLCDDALQHHALKKDISFLIIDGPFGIGNGLLLPAGPLREPFAEAVKRCDAAIIIGEDAQDIGSKLSIPVFQASLRLSGDISFLAQSSWLAFAGIGRPEKFYSTLRECGANIAATRTFPDHHPYNEAELKELIAQAEIGAGLVTTAKDGAKIPPELLPRIKVLPVTLQLADSAAFSNFLIDRLKPAPTS